MKSISRFMLIWLGLTLFWAAFNFTVGAYLFGLGMEMQILLTVLMPLAFVIPEISRLRGK